MSEWLTAIRLVIGGLVAVWLLVQTARRFTGNYDYVDPSVTIGRDYLLIRLSGIVAITGAVLVIAIAWAPEITSTTRGIWIGSTLLVLFLVWLVSEYREGFA